MASPADSDCAPAVGQRIRHGPEGSDALTNSWRMPGEEAPLHELGNYELVARLGQGGMGRVYKARHRNLKKFFALKTLRTDIHSPNEALLRFYREMEAIGRIDHPNVVRATDAGPLDGVDCLVMEYLEGIDLASLLQKDQRLPLELACEVTRQAASGLMAIEAYALVHRDIKPSNLFLCRDGQLKILDLGLARLMSEDSITRRGEVHGTADYIAPEVALGLGVYDAKADVYSLGCAFYKMLTGLAPFESDEQYDSFASKLQAHLTAEPPPVSGRLPSVPPEIAELLKRMLAKEPAERPDCREVAARVAEHVSADAVARLAALADWHARVAAVNENASSTPRGTSLAKTREAVEDLSPPACCQPARRNLLAAAALGGLLVLAPAALYLGGDRLWPTAPDEAVAARGELPVTPPADEEAGLLLHEAEVVPLVEEGHPNISFWHVDESRNLLSVQTDSLTMLSLGKLEEGDRLLAIDLQQVEWTGGCGLFFGYQTDRDERRIRYERIILTYNPRGEFLVARSLHEASRDSPIDSTEMLAEQVVPLKWKDKNRLELRFSEQRLSDVWFNGQPLPALVEVEEVPDAGSAPGQFGVWSLQSSTMFSGLQLNDQVLQLRAATEPQPPPR